MYTPALLEAFLGVACLAAGLVCLWSARARARRYRAKHGDAPRSDSSFLQVRVHVARTGCVVRVRR